MIERGWFHPAVGVVDARRVHITHQVSNVLQAARMLRDWRGSRGPKYRAAAIACVDWHEGRGDVEAVRVAFAAAVEEAGR